MKIRNILFSALIGLFIGVTTTACSDDDKYTDRGDLFQPRFLDDPVVNVNSITTVWYDVLDAESYTIEFHTSNYYNALFASYDTTEPFFFLDDIPYGTQYYIRVRSNAKNPFYNSQWATTNASVDRREFYDPTFAYDLVRDIEGVNITEESVIVEWRVEAENPVDSISVVAANENASSYYAKLTTAQWQAGRIMVEGLTKATQYTVNLYDTSQERTWDKPYNTIMFRTEGQSEDAIVISRGMDFSQILADNDDDPDFPDGAEYFLEAGTFFEVNTFQLHKGFSITGSTEGEMPIIDVKGTWNVAEGALISRIEFRNIEFNQSGQDAGYFMNSGNGDWVIDNVIFYNCLFTNGFNRGFWRHQGSSKSKRIRNMAFDYCTWDRTGSNASSYGSFNFGSGGYDQVDKAVFTNCTFMRVVTTMSNLWDYGDNTNGIHLEFRNITMYNYFENQGMIKLNEVGEGATLIIEDFLLASTAGSAIYEANSNVTLQFNNNYHTTDYLYGGSLIEATALGITADALFRNAANGDLTIVDTNSPVVATRSGDTRWLP